MAKEKINLAAVDISDVAEQEARDVAGERMTASQESLHGPRLFRGKNRTSREQLKGLGNLFKRIWKHNLFEEYYEHREYKQAKQEITGAKPGEENIYTAETIDRGAHVNAMHAITDRFLSEYEGMVAEDAGEKKEVVAADHLTTEKEALKNLIFKFAAGTISQEELVREQNNIITGIQGTDTTIDRQTMYATNITEIAKNIKAKLEHDAGLSAADFELELTLGTAKSGVRTEAKHNRIEGMVKKLEQYGTGRLVNETTLAVGVATVFSLGKKLSTTLARSKVAAYGTFGATALLAGGLAAVREGKKLEDERRLHAREMAKGKTFDETTSARRREMEQSRYETRQASELANRVTGLLYETYDPGNTRAREIKNLTQAELDEAMGAVADIENRIRESQAKRIDLISYSDTTKVEEEFNRLLIVKAQAKLDIQKLLNDEYKREVTETTQETTGTGPTPLEKLETLLASKTGTESLHGTVRGPESRDVAGELVTAQEIDDYLRSDEFQNAPDDPNPHNVASRQNKLSHWLLGKRLTKGFKIAPLETQFGSFSDDAASAYATWDWYRMEEILRAYNEPAPEPEQRTVTRTVTKTLGKQLKLPQDFGAHIARLVETQRGLSATETEKKDALFKKMKRSRQWQAARRGVVAGLAVGAVAQEVGAMLNDSQQGLAERAISGDNGPVATRATALEGLRSWLAGDAEDQTQSAAATVGTATANLHTAALEGTTHSVTLPDGYELTPNAGGSGFDLVKLDAAGKPVQILQESIAFAADGRLTPEAEQLLADQNITAATATNTIAHTTTETAQVNAKEYAANHDDEMTNIHHRLWYDNDTRAPVFDHNELKLHFGGVRGTGIDGDGNYVFSVKHMSPDGSWHTLNNAKLTADAQQLFKEGKLNLLVYISEDTQGQAFQIPINPDGTAVINPDSEAGKFFAEENGKLKQLARYVEVSETVGTEDGVMQIKTLATAEGKGLENVTDTVVKKSSETVGHTTFTLPPAEEPLAAEPPLERVTDLPPVIPLRGRLPLEDIIKKSPNFLPYYYMSNPSPALEEKFFKNRRSKTLNENPNAHLNHFEEIETYLKTWGEAYAKRVAELADQTDDMEETNKLSLCIPVAGHQEGKQIYQSLKNYTYQTVDPAAYEIVLYVNHPEKDRTTGDKIEPDETLREIERFKKDFPALNVRVMYEALPLKDAKIGVVRKLLNDATLLRHHRRGPDADDLIMVSNDADNKGIAPEYVQNFIDSFAKDKNVDGLLGQLDWDPEAYVKYPAVHIGTRLFQYLNIIGRNRTGRMSSSGANFAFKSSIYAGIGGYIDELEGGEDIAVGQAITAARQRPGAIGFAGARASRVYTSARRAIDALRSDLSPIEQWDKGFSAFDDEVRKMELTGDASTIDYDDEAVQQKLKTSLEYVINQTLDVYERGENLGKNAPYYKKALNWLGIKYEVVNNVLTITNMDKLIGDLKTYQKEGVLQRDAKSGKIKAQKKLEKNREEKIKVDETKDLESSVEENLKKFYEKDTLDFGISQDTHKIADIKTSAKKEKIDNYIVAQDKVIRETENGRVVWAYQEANDDDIFVCKELGESALAEMRTAKNTPRGVPDPETYLQQKGVSHPNILLPEKTYYEDEKIKRIYKAGQMDLGEFLKKERTLTPKEAVSVMIRVCDGVRNMHDVNAVHGDIQPDNIIIFENKDVKIADLDTTLLKKEGDAFFTKKGGWGNRFVLPPEMLRQEQKVIVFDKTVDVYEAGITLYRLLAGSWPYNIEKEMKDKGATTEEKKAAYQKLHESGDVHFPPSIPPLLQKIIKKAMSPWPSKRYQSMEALLSDLLQAYNTL